MNLFLWAVLLRQDLPSRDVTELVRRLGAADVEGRDEAAQKLKEKGIAAAPALLKALQDPDPEMAERARSVLRAVALREWRVGDAAKTIPEVLSALGHEGPPTFEPRQVVHLGRGYNVIAPTPDLAALAQGSTEDGSIRLLDLAGGRELRRWPAHPTCSFTGSRPSVRLLAYSPDACRLASAGRDGTVAVWDPETARELLRLPSRYPGSLAFTPDGKRLAFASSVPGRPSTTSPSRRTAGCSPSRGSERFPSGTSGGGTRSAAARCRNRGRSTSIPARSRPTESGSPRGTRSARKSASGRSMNRPARRPICAHSPSSRTPRSGAWGPAGATRRGSPGSRKEARRAGPWGTEPPRARTSARRA